MKNVTINSKKYEISGEEPILLKGGSLVIHYKNSNVLGAYMVIPYSDCICNLVDLDTGYIFEAGLERSTTVGKIITHITHNRSDKGGKNLIKEGHYIEVYLLGEYKIDLKIEQN